MSAENLLPALAAMFVAGLLYGLPTLLALSRSHNRSGLLFLVNLLFGWTGVGWLYAFGWAVYGKARHDRHAIRLL
jgi:hypothetical protein